MPELLRVAFFPMIGYADRCEGTSEVFRISACIAKESPVRAVRAARIGVGRRVLASLKRHRRDASVAKTLHRCRENATVGAPEASLSGVTRHETNPSEPKRNPDASPEVPEATANEPEHERPGGPAFMPQSRGAKRTQAPAESRGATARRGCETNPRNPGEPACAMVTRMCETNPSNPENRRGPSLA